MQLLEPERGPRFDASGAFERLREGLLRDNKVLPPVLGALALIIFAWIVAGTLVGSPPDQGGRQVANQADQAPSDLAQNPGDDAGPLDAENRDAESFSQFESKNPFGEPPGVGPADQDGGTGDTGTGDDGTGDSGTGDSGTGSGGTGSDGTGSDQYGGDDQYGDGGGDDFIDQTFPNGRGSGSGTGSGTGNGGTGNTGGGVGGGGDDSGGGDDLFDSGGSLSP